MLRKTKLSACRSTKAWPPVRFWDSSAIVPLCLVQPASVAAQALLGEDPEMIVWWGSTVEVASAVSRLHREGGLSPQGEESAFRALRVLQATWHEVQPTDALRRRAERLLRVHPLRSGDALQLAAALAWAGDPPHGQLATFDRRLARAARREGLTVPSGEA